MKRDERIKKRLLIIAAVIFLIFILSADQSKRAEAQIGFGFPFIWNTSGADRIRQQEWRRLNLPPLRVPLHPQQPSYGNRRRYYSPITPQPRPRFVSPFSIPLPRIMPSPFMFPPLPQPYRPYRTVPRFPNFR
jgi:hypothetical protein